MSSYRDDTQETVTASSSTWGRTHELLVEIAKIGTLVLSTIVVSHADTVQISDNVSDRITHVVEDTVAVSNETQGKLYAINTFTDNLKISDRDFSVSHFSDLIIDPISVLDTCIDKVKLVLSDQVRVAENVSDHLVTNSFVSEKFKVRDQIFQTAKSSNAISDIVLISDTVLDNNKLFISDSFKISDQAFGTTHSSVLIQDSLVVEDSVISQRRATEMVSDNLSVLDAFSDKLKAISIDELKVSDRFETQLKTSSIVLDRIKISDKLISIDRNDISETINISDSEHGQRKVFDLVTDSLILSEDFLQNNAQHEILTDQFKISDYVSGTLHATNIIIDTVMIEDDVLGGNVVSDWAWTSNTDSWGMSRYSDFPYDQLVVINGVLHGINAEGVFALDSSQMLNGTVVTPKIDLGEGGLIHPQASYLEYSLSGVDKSLDIAVKTTQSGDELKYTYRLPNENSDQLTNGRVVFGRGLCGRHFSFELNVRADAAQINDLSIDFTKTKRRI